MKIFNPSLDKLINSLVQLLVRVFRALGINKSTFISAEYEILSPLDGDYVFIYRIPRFYHCKRKTPNLIKTIKKTSKLQIYQIYALQAL